MLILFPVKIGILFNSCSSSLIFLSLFFIHIISSKVIEWEERRNQIIKMKWAKNGELMCEEISIDLELHEERMPTFIMNTTPSNRPFVSKVGSFVLFPFVLSLHASFFIVSERQKEKAKRNHSQQLMVVFCLFFVPFIKITLFIPFQLYFNEREQKNKVNTRLHLNFLFSLSFVLIEWKER